MMRIPKLLIAISLLCASFGTEVRAQPAQRVLTMQSGGVWRDWDDFQHWLTFITSCDTQNRKVLKVFEKELVEKGENARKDYSQGSIGEDALKAVEEGLQRRARELIAYEKIQDEITGYLLRRGRSGRMSRIAEKVDEISKAEGADMVILVSDEDVLFAEKGLPDITRDVVEALEKEDREELEKRRAEEREGAESGE